MTIGMPSDAGVQIVVRVSNEEAVVSRWVRCHEEAAMPADGRWLRAGKDRLEAAEALYAGACSAEFI